jgi:hypothetical protein
MTTRLTIPSDQQQQSFATLQAQLSQMSLETNSGIQMILDQQRCAQNPASGYFIHQNRKPSISYFISQGLYGPVQSSVDLHEQVCIICGIVEFHSDWTLNSTPHGFQS